MFNFRYFGFVERLNILWRVLSSFLVFLIIELMIHLSQLINYYWDIILLIIIQIWIIFFLNALFLRAHSEHPTTFVVCLWAPWSSFFCFWWPWWFWEVLFQHFIACPFTEITWYCHHDSTGIIGLGDREPEAIILMTWCQEPVCLSLYLLVMWTLISRLKWYLFVGRVFHWACRLPIIDMETFY